MAHHAGQAFGVASSRGSGNDLWHTFNRVQEKGDLITIREQGRRTKHSARLYDAPWWMLRCQADKVRMEELRERKAKNSRRLAERRSGTTEGKRMF